MKFIEKSNGKLRPLGIPVVKDRVVQGAVKLILEPIFETNFMNESYGFRSKRSCQDALRSTRKWVTYGYSPVIDADISAYFDNVDPDLLLMLIQRRIRDKWIIRLIRGWLKCQIFEQDRKTLSEKGTPQGGVISPLLANIYLHPLDKLEEGFDFLGVRLHLKPTRKDRSWKFCYGFPTPKAMNRVRSSVRETRGRDYQKSLNHRITYLNPILRGWVTYYSWLNSAEHTHKIERYVIQKLNRWNRRKQKRVRQGGYRKLQGLTLQKMGLYRMSGRIERVA